MVRLGPTIRREGVRIGQACPDHPKRGVYGWWGQLGGVVQGMVGLGRQMDGWVDWWGGVGCWAFILLSEEGATSASSTGPREPLPEDLEPTPAPDTDTGTDASTNAATDASASTNAAADSSADANTDPAPTPAPQLSTPAPTRPPAPTRGPAPTPTPPVAMSKAMQRRKRKDSLPLGRSEPAGSLGGGGVGGRVPLAGKGG